MRLLEKATYYIATHPTKNVVHRTLRKIWFIPIVGTDYVKMLVKTNGNIESDPLWNAMLDLISQEGGQNGQKALEITNDPQSSYRKTVLGIEE